MRSPALLLALLLGAAAPSRAAETPGITAAPVLQIPLGARAVGMGGAFTAVASDAAALYYNPAGLSRLNAQEVGLSFISGLSDNNLQQFAYGGPLPLPGLTGNGYVSAGASLLVSQDGRIEVNKTNPDGSFRSSENLSAGSDYVASLGYSERLAATPVETPQGAYGLNHFVGVSGKFVRSTLAQQYSADAFAADVGYLLSSPEAGLSLGMSALNLGGRLKYVDVADPLPTTLRGGLAWQMGPSAGGLLVAGDGEWLTHEKQWRANAGLEYFWLKTCGLRLGYQFHQDSGALTVGLGLRWKSQILIDYAWAMSQTLNDSHRVTLTWRFDPVAPGSRGVGHPFIETGPDREQLRGINEQRPEIEPPLPPERPFRRSPQPQEGVPGWVY